MPFRFACFDVMENGPEWQIQRQQITTPELNPPYYIVTKFKKKLYAQKITKKYDNIQYNRLCVI
jgi:hypothetical protein